MGSTQLKLFPSMTAFYYFFLVKKKKIKLRQCLLITSTTLVTHCYYLLLMAKPIWAQKNASSQFSFCITVTLSSSCGEGQGLFQVITDGPTDVESCFEMGN